MVDPEAKTRGYVTVGGNGRILVVDDDPHVCRVLRTILVKHGYEVWEAQTGDEALDSIRSEKFDLVLLDLNLPDLAGIELCREIRAVFDLVIIVLTARSNERDTVAVLDAGADDYVIKPFDASELLARIRAKLRRHRKAGSDLFTFNEVVVDFAKRTVSRRDKKMRLPPKQYQLLRYFVSHRGESLSHRTLLQAIWGPDYGEETGLLQAVIMQIRKKIEPHPAQPRYIVTIPWFGYRFDSPLENESTVKDIHQR
jgi:two-component system, OmpR family, KDP operon response regulator KdpE